jgi:ABC-type dipeptide/oligopeptide/nickel transport system permease subunit
MVLLKLASSGSQRFVVTMIIISSSCAGLRLARLIPAGSKVLLSIKEREFIQAAKAWAEASVYFLRRFAPNGDL